MNFGTTPFRSIPIALAGAVAAILSLADCAWAARPSSRNAKSLSSQVKKEQTSTRSETMPKVAKKAPVAPDPAKDAPRASAGTPAVESVSSMDGDQEIIVETVRGFTPSTEKIPPSAKLVQFWGIVLADAPFFTEEGKRCDEKLPGGSLVEQIGSVRSSKGEMAKIYYWNGAVWKGVCLVSTADLVRFEGGRSEVDAEGVDDLRTYYMLVSALERRKAELIRLEASKNPFYADLKALSSSYNSNEKTIKKLTVGRDGAKGAKRAKLADELRRLEVQVQRQKIQIKELSSRYENWKTEHGDVEINVDADSECAAIQAKMAAIKPGLASFGL